MPKYISSRQRKTTSDQTFRNLDGPEQARPEAEFEHDESGGPSHLGPPAPITRFSIRLPLNSQTRIVAPFRLGRRTGASAANPFAFATPSIAAETRLAARAPRQKAAIVGPAPLR